nr:DUF493 domain-containing protein [Campylobacter anatolicus]
MRVKAEGKVASICDINGQKPEIRYPTFWEYKLIMNATDDAIEQIKKIIGTRDSKAVFSKFSKDKRYASYDVSVFVLSDQERLELFSAFKRISKFVL